MPRGTIISIFPKQSIFQGQLTCLPSWPTLVWPLTTVLMLSSRRLPNVKEQFIHTEGKIQTRRKIDKKQID